MLTADLFNEIKRLNFERKYLQSYSYFKDEDIRDWPKDLAQIHAAKTLKMVGSPRLGDAIILKNLRSNPSDPDTLFAGLNAFC